MQLHLTLSSLFLRPLDYLIEVVYPSSCIICNRPTPCPTFSTLVRKLPLETLFCPECRSELSVTDRTFCKRCGNINPNPLHNEICNTCSPDDYYFDEIYPLHFYRSIPRAVILSMKHDSKKILATAMARIYCQERRQQLEKFQPDCIVATPMNWRRFFLRGGINAPVVIAHTIANELHIPCFSKYVKRTRATSTQASVEWNDRLSNIYDAFEVTEFKNQIHSLLRTTLKKTLINVWKLFPNQRQRFRPIELSLERFIKNNLSIKPSIFKNKKVILVDDVFTSGSTTNEIARVLRDAGAQKIYIATIARAGLGKQKKHRAGQSKVN